MGASPTPGAAERLVRNLAERAIVATVAGEGRVAIRAPGDVLELWKALTRRLPRLPAGVEDGRLLVDPRALREEEIEEAADAIHEAMRNLGERWA